MLELIQWKLTFCFPDVREQQSVARGSFLSFRRNIVVYKTVVAALGFGLEPIDSLRLVGILCEQRLRAAEDLFCRWSQLAVLLVLRVVSSRRSIFTQPRNLQDTCATVSAVQASLRYLAAVVLAPRRRKLTC